MEIQELSQGAVTVLKPIGPLTGADAVQFKTRAMELIICNLGRVLVDASGVPFVDSQGLEALVDVTEELGRSGRALKLCAATLALRSAVQLTGWGDAFEHFEDINSGVRSFL